MDKLTVSSVVFVVIIFAISLLRAGSSSSSTKFKSEVDLCIEEGFKDICIENTKIFVPPIFRHYGSTGLVEGFSFVSITDEKITDSSFVEERAVKTVVELVHMLNQTHSIRPYLNRFPVSVKHVIYELQFRNTETKKFYDEPCIALALYKTPKLVIDVFHNKDNPIKEGEEVDWVGRKLLYKKQREDIPQLQALVDVSVPRTKKVSKEIRHITSLPTNFCSKFKRVFNTYFDAYTRRKGFKIACLTSAADNRGSGTYRPIAVGMWAHKTMNIEEAKILAKTIFTDFYRWSLTNSGMVEFVEKYRKLGDKQFENKNEICFRVTFWDEYFNRVEEPYIAQILCQDSVIEYYTADEGQRLVKIYEEPVPDVKKE